MKKILIFTSYFIPGYLGGGPIKSIANLTNLLSGDYEFFVLTKNYDLGQKKQPYNISTNKWIRSNKFQIKYLTDVQYKMFVLSNILKIKPDVIYFNSFFSMTTQLNLIKVRVCQLFGHKIKVVVAPRGEFDEGAMSLSNFKKEIFIKFFKIFRYRDIVFQATSSIEYNFICSRFPKNRITLAQNIPATQAIETPRKKVAFISKFIFYSRITPKKNLLFALDILADLKIEGKLEFVVVGPAENEEYYNQCLLKKEAMPANISVDFLGPKFPYEIEEILGQQDFFFFPTLGENYGHVIYESLSQGLPVLISTETPWKEGGLDNGIFASTLDNKKYFVDTIMLLHKMDDLEYQNLSQKARVSAFNSFDSEEIKKEYNILFS